MRQSPDAFAFYKAILGAVAAHGFALAISFIGSVLMTRMLGAEGRGIYSWLVSLSIIGSVLAQAGMGHANRRFVAGRHHRSAILFTLTVIVCTTASLIAIIIMAFIALQDPIGYENKDSLIVALIIIPLSAISITSGEMLVGLHKHAQYSSLNVIERSTNTFLLVFFILIGIISPFTAVIALSIAFLARLLIIIYYLRYYIKPQLKGARNILTHIGAFTFYNYLAASLLFLSTHILTIFVGSISNARQVGWFVTNMVIITALRQLASITATFALPRLARISGFKERTDLKRIIMLITFIMTAIAAIIFTLSANWVIPLIFGKEFIPTIAGFKILLIGLVFCGMIFVFQSFIASDSKSYVVIIPPAILMICTIISGIYLIPQHGALGAAYSWSISHAIAMIISGIIAIRIHRKRKSL